MPIQSQFSRWPRWLRFAAATAPAFVLLAALSLTGGCASVSSVATPLEPDFYIAHMQDPNAIWFKSGSANPVPLAISALSTGTSVNDLAALRFTGPSDWLYLVSVNGSALVILTKVGSAFQLVATVPVGVAPFGLAIDDNASFGYVSNTGGNSVTVVDLTTNQTAATITLPAGSQPRGIAVTPDGAKVYVANSGTDTVSIIDTATRTVTGSITVGSQPYRVAMSPNGHELYVSNTASGNVSVIDVLSDSVSTTISGASNTRAVAVSGAGTDLFIGQAPALSGPGSVALYDTTTVASNTTPTATAANPAYLLGIGPGSFLSADQNAGRVTEQWATIGNPVVNKVLTVGTAPAALAIVREVNRAPSTPPQCQLTVTTVGSGTVAVNPASSDGNYTCGATVTLTATPGTGSQFTQWSGDLTGSANPATLQMATAKNVTATFSPVQNVVTTVQANSPFVVGLYITVDGTSWAGHAQYTASAGSTHTHTTTTPQIVSGTQYTFQNWTPSPAPNVATALTQTVVLPNTNTAYIANFAQTGYVVSTYGCPVTITSSQQALSTDPLVYPLNAPLTINTSLPSIEVFQNNAWNTYVSFPVNLTLSGPVSIWAPCTIQKSAVCVAPPSGIAGWWGFDTNGSSSSPDLSGNNNNGILFNGVTQAAGKVQGFLPSGTTYFQAPSSSSLNFGTGPFSADMWVRWSDPSKNLGDSWLLSKYAPGHGFDFALTRATESPGFARLMVRVTDGNVSSAQAEWDTIPPAVPSDGAWHLVAFSYDPSQLLDNRVIFYVDGVQTPSAPFNVSNTQNLPQTVVFDVSSLAPLQVGTYENPIPSLSFNGGIDEVELFNRVITAADLQRLMSADALGKCKPGETVAQTVTTSPAGLQVQIDKGAVQTAPVQVSWIPGSAHILSAPLPQTNASGDTQYGNAPAWSPAGPYIASAPSTAILYTGTFAPTGYRLTVVTSPADCATAALNPAVPTSGFYSPAQVVRVSATPAAGFVVTSIAGTANGSVTMSQPQTVTINCQRPTTVTAAYSKESVAGNIVLIHTNTGSTTATNLRINSVVSNTDGIAFDQGVVGNAGLTFPWVLGDLGAGQSTGHNLGFRASGAAGTINVAFSFTIKYQAENMDEQTVVIRVPFPR